MYKTLSSYLKEKYGCKVKKICIDGGFTCPNRDGRCGVGGCIFCGERGSGEHIITHGARNFQEEVRIQVETALSSATDNSVKYIAYFQNFTNTYDTIPALKARYDNAVFDDRIAVLAIGTRPDCINEDIARLIASYKDKVDVWVELGLQTSSDKTAKIINRGYESRVFKDAVKTLKKYDIPVVAHLMIGLPEEGKAELIKTLEFLNEEPVWGVKIHSVYVSRHTELCGMYERGEYTPISMDEYVDLAVLAIKMLPEDTVIHRVTGDCPKDLLVAPLWNTRKNEVISRIRAAFAD